MVPAATPLALNPAPEVVTPEIVMFEFPVFWMVTLSELLLPTLTLPKLKLEGFAVIADVAATPVPLNAIARGDPGALLVIDIEPLALPAADGAKAVSNATLPPAATVCAESPVWLKPAPVTVTCEIVRLAVPVFFNVIACELLVPTTTLPKLALDGVTATCGCVPVPLNGIASGEPGALLLIEILPLALAVDAGANPAVNNALCPALMVRGVDNPLMLKPDPVTLVAEMVMPAVPVFFNVMLVEPLLPICTPPKLTLGGVAVSPPSVPVPLREIASGESEASLIIASDPVSAPADCGKN